MEINLAPLLAQQALLDARINNEHQVTHESTKDERFLALLVEIGELANATRVFKYWSLKPGEERVRLLDEYADGLHFFLSLALVYKIDLEVINYEEADTTKKVVISQFKNVYLKINKLMNYEDKRSYLIALASFLTLGSALAFSSEDIIKAYNDKLVVNYKRQDTKY